MFNVSCLLQNQDIPFINVIITVDIYLQVHLITWYILLYLIHWTWGKYSINYNMEPLWPRGVVILRKVKSKKMSCNWLNQSVLNQEYLKFTNLPLTDWHMTDRRPTWFARISTKNYNSWNILSFAEKLRFSYNLQSLVSHWVKVATTIIILDFSFYIKIRHLSLNQKYFSL